jgi:PAS domain S-box-containing protein
MKHKNSFAPPHFFEPLLHIWNWLITPSAALSPELQRMARMLFAFQILIVVLGGVSQVIYMWSFPDLNGDKANFIILLGLVALVCAYGLGKLGRVKLSALIVVSVVFLEIFLIMLVQPGWESNIDFMMYMIIPVIMGNLFFRNKTLYRIAIIQIVAILSLSLFSREMNFWVLVNGPVSFLVLVTALLLVTNHYHSMVVADRQSALVASEERFRQMAENIQDVFWSYERVSDRLLYVSPAYERIFGQSSSAFYEHPSSILEKVYPDDRSNIREKFHDIEQGRAVSFQCRVIVDATVRWVWVRGFPILGPQGEVLRMAGSITDISENKKVEQALKTNESFLQSIVRSSPGYIVTADLSGNLLYANRRWSGLNETEACAVNLIDLVHPVQQARIREIFKTLVETRNIQSCEFQFLDENGSYRWAEAFFSPVIIDDEVKQVTVFVSDIHDRKLAEAELQNRSREINLLYEASQEMGRTLALGDLYQMLYRHLAGIMACDGLFISSFDAQAEMIRCVYAILSNNLLEVSGFPVIPLEPAGQGTQSQVIRSGQAWLLNDYQAQVKKAQNKYYVSEEGEIVDFEAVPADEEVTRSAIILPILLNGQVVGVVQIFSFKINAYSQSNLNIAESLVAQFSVASNNAVLYQRAQVELAERRRAEEALKASEANYRSLVEDSESIIIVLDKRGRILYANPQGIKIWNDPEVVGKTISAIYPRKYSRLYQASIRHVINTKTSLLDEVESEINGRLMWFRLSMEPLVNPDGSVDRLLLSALDITERKQAEQILAENEARYRQAIMAADAIPYSLDYASNRYTFIGEAIEKFTGYSAEAFTPELFHNLIDESIMQGNFLGMTRDEAAARLRSGKYGHLWRCDHHLHTYTGDERWISDASTQISDENGTPKGSIGILQDITEWKKNEVALRQSETKYRRLASELKERVKERTAELQDLYDKAPCGYHSLDRNGIFVMINQTELNWLGYTREEMLGYMNIRDVLTSSGRERYEADFAMLKQQGWLKDIEVDFVCKDGRLLPMLLNATAVYDANGAYLMNRVTVFDITEHKEAERTLERQNNTMVSLYNITLSLFQQTDLDKMLQIIIDEAVHLVNAAHAEISILENENTLVVRATTPKLRQLVGYVARQGEDSHLSWEAVETGKPVQNYDYTTYPSRMDFYRDIKLGATMQIPIKMDRVIGILSLGRDYPSAAFSSEDIGVASLLAQLAAEAIQSAQLYGKVSDELAKRRRIEDVLRKNRDELSAANAALEKAARLKDEFLASMSHELRTPLTGILGLSEALQLQTYGTLTPKQLKALSNIESSGRHLLELINDILDLSKIEAGKLDLQIGICSLADICQSSLQLTKGMAQQRRHTVGFSINPASILVQADARRLKQMLVNLLSNAIKFTPEGGELGLDVQASAAEQVVRLSVWDHGIGIQPEDREKLFKPFSQLDSSLTRQQSGTGLGLALVQKMAELHGGSIQVTSAPGEGSRFTILLPWRAETAQFGALANPAITRLRRALIVETADPEAEVTAHYLQNWGIASSLHATAEGVVEKTLEVRPGVILLDLMAHEAGFAVLAELKSNAQTSHIPVIMLSSDERRAEALALGAVGYLVKPYAQEDLRQELERVMAARAALKKPQAESALGAGPLVLLADDNEIVLEALADYLAAQNYRVVAARSGKELVQLAGETCPDIILTDIQMPGSDGLTAIRQIRAHTNPQIARVPIIAITALAMPGDRERCLAAGANEYLSKPVHLENLVEIIQKFLDGDTV